MWLFPLGMFMLAFWPWSALGREPPPDLDGMTADDLWYFLVVRKGD